MTFTYTPTPSETFTPTDTFTFTSTFTLTDTFSPTDTPTSTPTSTCTDTPTSSDTFTPTWTDSATPTGTDTFTSTFSFTPTPTDTNTASPTDTTTNTFTATPTWTITDTPTLTATSTWTGTDTDTFTPVDTSTNTTTPTIASTATVTPTRTATATNTPSNTMTLTLTPSNTPAALPPGTNFVGNQAPVDGYDDFLMMSPTSQGSVRFTSRQSGTLTFVMVYFSQATGSPFYYAEIQGDNAGVPNGIVLGSSSTYLLGSNQWIMLMFGSTHLTAGTVYHLVMRAGTVDPSNYATWRIGTSPGHHLFPYDQVADPNQGTAKNLGAGWVASSEQPVFDLVFGAYPYSFDGNPYSVGTEYQVNSGSFLGERFVVAAAPLTLQGVGAYVKKVGSPTADLNWQIKSESNGATVASGTLVNAGAAPGTYQWVDASASVTLGTGIYRFVLLSGTAPGSDYRWISGNIGGGGGFGSTPLTYGGETARAGQSFDGINWSDFTSGQGYNDDFAFRLLQSTVAVTPTPTPTALPPGMDFVGNQAPVDGYDEFPMMNQAYQGSIRFTARRTDALNIVWLYFSQSTGGQYVVEIQADNAGVPSGTALARSVTFYGNYGWTMASFSPMPNLTAESVYHLVLKASSVNATSYATWRLGSSPGHHLYPYDQVLDPNQATLKNVGVGWATSVDQPIFALTYGVYPNFNYDGNPYGIGTEYRVNASSYLGERFVVAAAPLTLQGVGAYVKKVGVPTADLQWQIQRESDGTTVVSGTLVTAGSAPGAYQWVDAPTTGIVPTGVYRFVLLSGTNPGTDYRWISGGGEALPGASSMTYDGDRGRAVTSATGTNWMNISYLGYTNDDFAFRILRSTVAATPTDTPTFTATPSITPTLDPTDTPFLTSTQTPTATTTIDLNQTPSFTATAELTDTPTIIPPLTSTDTATSTIQLTVTSTETPTMQNTYTETPTYTATPTTTPHTSPTSAMTPPPGVYWDLAEFGRYRQAGITLIFTNLQISANRRPDPTASVTLTTPLGPVPLVNFMNTDTYSHFSPSGGVSYIPGGTYILTTVTSAGTAAATLVAPGGNIVITPDGKSATWDVEGNEDYLFDNQFASYNVTSDIDSPYSIPDLAYPAAGTYNVSLYSQNTTYNVSGVSVPCRFTIKDSLTVPVVK